MSFFKNIAVVILNYNNWKDTVACVESVLASTYAPKWVFVVDNASTDASIEKMQHWAQGTLKELVSTFDGQSSFPKPIPYQNIFTAKRLIPPSSEQLIFIHSVQNKGYAAGNNQGIRLAMEWGAEAVWILNNDTIVEKQALGAMQERLFITSRPGLCGSLVCYVDTGLVQCCGGGMTNFWTALSKLYGHNKSLQEVLQYTSTDVERNINFIYGASVMVSREFIQTVGLMDERYFLYCEEQDWVYSAKGRFDISYAPKALVHHKEGGTTGFSSTKMSVRSLWYLTRSRILLTYKHKIWALPTVFLSIGFAAIRMFFRRIFKR